MGGNAARDSEPTAVIAASASCHHPCTAPIASAGQESAAAPALVLRNGTWTMEVAAGCDPALLRLALRAIK